MPDLKPQKLMSRGGHPQDQVIARGKTVDLVVRGVSGGTRQVGVLVEGRLDIIGLSERWGGRRTLLPSSLVSYFGRRASLHGNNF